MAEPQFKIRRNETTGRIESVPEEEQATLRAEHEAVKPAKRPGALTQTDRDFIAANTEQEPPTLSPAPPLPEPTRRPAIVGQAIPEPPAVPGAATAEAAATGAAAGGVVGGAGAAAIFLATQAVSTAASKKGDPIGTLTGGQSATSEDEATRTLRELLSVQQQIQREGSPVKGAVETIAKDSII